MFFDPMYFVFMIPGLLFTLWAQSRVKGTFHKYKDVRNVRGVTGAQAARIVLDSQGLYDVAIERVQGELSDHYDPRHRVLRLSQSVHDVPSIAAIGIAAHEAGHAVQHAQAYGWLKVRTAIVPLVSIGSNIGFGLIFLGFFIGAMGLATVGIVLFALTTVFALITLPVEFNASSRARELLLQTGLIDSGVAGGQEAVGVQKVLGAAAWTYIAGFAVSVLQLLYYVSLVSGRSRD